MHVQMPPVVAVVHFNDHSEADLWRSLADVGEKASPRELHAVVLLGKVHAHLVPLCQRKQAQAPPAPSLLAVVLLQRVSEPRDAAPQLGAVATLARSAVAGLRHGPFHTSRAQM